MQLKVLCNVLLLVIGENAVHGSDSDENAALEGSFHLQVERFTKLRKYNIQRPVSKGLAFFIFLQPTYTSNYFFFTSAFPISSLIMRIIFAFP